MPQLTITLSDAVVTRVRAALGENGTPATVAEVEDIVKEYLRARVARYEGQATQATTQSESW